MPDQMSLDAWQTMLTEQSRLMWGDEQTEAIGSSLHKAAKHLSILSGVALDPRHSVPFGIESDASTSGADA